MLHGPLKQGKIGAGLQGKTGAGLQDKTDIGLQEVKDQSTLDTGYKS